MNQKSRLVLIAGLLLAIFTALNILVLRKKSPSSPSASTSGQFKNRVPNQSQKVHLIGTAKGKPLPGADTRVWWEKCPKNKISSVDCHKKYAGETYKTSVDVTLKDLSGDVMLVAMSTETQTHWNIRNQARAKLVKVILLGIHEQTVSGISPDTQIEVYTYKPSPCDRCYRGPPTPITANFDETLLPVLDSIRNITGHDPSSVQLGHTVSDFFVSDRIRQFDRGKFENGLKQKKCELIEKEMKNVKKYASLQQKKIKNSDNYAERLNSLRSQFELGDCAP